MTWRRFLVLLRGLSPESLLALKLRSEEDPNEPPEAETDEQAEQMFYKMLGVNPKEGD